jgi:hypothetical protein
MIFLILFLMPVIGMAISDSFISGFITVFAMIGVAAIWLMKKK